MTASAFIKVDKATFYRFIAREPKGRFEFVRGRIMQQQPGGTKRHAQIGARFLISIAQQIDARTLDICGPDRGIDTGETVRYADVVVEPVGADPASRSTERPVLIVEVLSPSSGDRDLDVKPAEYLALASLEAYIIASQDEPACYLWVRDAGRNFPAEPVALRGLDQVIAVPALRLSIPLGEVYRGIGGEAPAAGPA